MKEVVILGAGVCWIASIARTARAKEAFHITLIDKNDYHYEANRSS